MTREEIIKSLRYLNRNGCEIKVTSLDPVHSVQRMVYGLLKKSACVPKDNDHEIFKRLTKKSQGETTTVHMLTSLMQKFDDNRESFECISQQLQHYILVEKLPQNIASDSEVHSILPPQNDICMYNSYILQQNLSQPAYHLLNCLCIVGPIPFIKLYVEELSYFVTADTTNKNQIGLTSSMLVKEIEKVGVIRKYPYPILYHKYLNPDSSIHDQLIIIPKQICKAVRNKMDDKGRIAIMHLVQQALYSLITHKLNSIHLLYILVLCRELWDFCDKKQQPELANNFCKLMNLVAVRIRPHK